MMAKKTLLVVEDEEKMRSGLQEFFTDKGYDVETAEDGLKAVNRLKERPFDAVLADLKMPRLDGIGLLQRTRELRPRTVFIMITGYGSIDTAAKAIKLGASDYITKPFAVEDLAATVEKALATVKESALASASRPFVKTKAAHHTDKKKTLLVVEDEEKMRSGLQEFFTDKGYDVETAEDGLKVVNRLKKRSFDVVLADLKMPRLDGMGLLRRTRKLRPSTVFIMITGYGSIDTAVEAIRLGASDYITKPFAVEDLATAVEDALATVTEVAPPPVVPVPVEVRPGDNFPPHFWEGCFIYACGKSTCPFTADCFAAQGRHQRQTERFIEAVNQTLLEGRAPSPLQQAEVDHAVRHHGVQFDSERGIYLVNKAAVKSRPGLGAAFYR